MIGRKLSFTAALATLLTAMTVTAAPAQAAPISLKVLTFNLWYGGSKVDNGRAKQLKVIRDSGADVVGLQEHMGNSAQELSDALGWYYHPGDNRVAIISRYPITDRQEVPSPIPCCLPGFEDFSEDVAISASVRVDGRTVRLWNTHQMAEFYGPYSLCFDGWPAPLVETQEQLTRGLMMRLTLDAMSADLDGKSPVIVTGDFNAPSHLDYTDATAAQHCGYGTVNWPVSRMAADAGLVDSFRKANPDPATTPGNTWSPITPTNDGRPEPQDRIDFIYTKGLTVADSRTIVAGDPLPVDDPNHVSNEWPSDHAAVLTTFKFG